MSELTKFDKNVYKAIIELLKERPDGELTYTKILVSYLQGTSNKEIPWSVIQTSKIYGKYPKANLISVLMSCNKLVDEDLLTKVKIGTNYKYFKTSFKLKPEYSEKTFGERVSGYKKYLLTAFSNYMTSFCPSIISIDRENYYGFVNKNPIHFNEYNWFWLTNESEKANSLKLFVRKRPNKKELAFVLDLSYSSFYDCISDLIDVLISEKSKYKLAFNRKVVLPNLEPPVEKEIKQINKTRAQEEIDISFFDSETNAEIFLNNGDSESINASLSVSESSPYKYSGDTIFAPKELKKLVQGKTNFDFSFLKWKIAAWTVDNDDPKFIHNALLINKKTKDYWVFISISKRKITCVTTNNFKISYKNRFISSNELINMLFDKASQV